MSEDFLELALHDARGLVEREAAARTRALPAAVAEALAAEGKVVAFPAPPAEGDAVDLAIAAAREVVEAEAVVRQAKRSSTSGLAPLPTVTGRRRGGIVWLGAIAALLVAGLLTWTLLGARESAQQRGQQSEGGGVAAAYTGARQQATQRALPKQIQAARGAARKATGPDLAPRPDGPLDAEPEPEPEPEPQAPTKPRKPTLDELDALAQSQWKAGDLEGATATFETIVRRGKKSRQADLAYGDLFTLDAQRTVSVVPRWKAYLKRFPQGRWADDARAGLCRKSGPPDRATCWTDYLEHHPDGLHAATARRHTGGSEATMGQQ